MTIEVKEENTYLCFWYCQFKHEPGDMMGACYKEPDGPWILIYRFRYYKSENAWDGKDEKNWYKLRAPDGSDAHAARAKHMVKCLIDSQREYFSSAFYYDIDGDGKKMMEFLTRGDRPWIHVQKFTSREEAEAFIKSQQEGG